MHKADRERKQMTKSRGRSVAHKTAVLPIVERGGRCARRSSTTWLRTLPSYVHDAVEPGLSVFTDAELVHRTRPRLRPLKVNHAEQSGFEPATSGYEPINCRFCRSKHGLPNGFRGAEFSSGQVGLVQSLAQILLSVSATLEMVPATRMSRQEISLQWCAHGAASPPEHSWPK